MPLNGQWSFFLLSLLYGFSCTTLQESSRDQQMRYQGSYSCEHFTRENRRQETLAEADVARIRCAKDRWGIYGSEVHFTRSLYQDAECLEELGVIEFTSPLHEEAEGYSFDRPSCHLTRKSPAWLGEDSGRCMLHQIELNRPVSLRYLSRCTRYVPETCRASTNRQVIAKRNSPEEDSRKPFDQVSFGGEGCTRYDAP